KWLLRRNVWRTVMQSISSGDAAEFPTESIANWRIAFWIGANAAGGASVCILHDGPACWIEGVAKKYGGPQPERFAATSAGAKRFEFAGARDARHVGRARAVSVDGVDCAIRPNSRRFECGIEN